MPERGPHGVAGPYGTKIGALHMPGSAGDVSI